MANTRTPRNKTFTIADVVASAKPVERVVPLCVAGDLHGEHRRLVEAQERAEDAEIGQSKKLVESERESVKIAKQVVAIQKKMEPHTFDFRFQKLDDDKWDEMLSAHPVRDGNDTDKQFGVNMATFPKAAVQACCVDPTGFEDVEAFEQFWGTLNSGQRDKLYFGGAFAVNRTDGVEIPKSVSASALINSSE